MRKSITAIMITAVLILLFTACGSKDKGFFVGKYDGKKIYAFKEHPEAIMGSIEEAIVDLDAFKVRENQKYQESVTEAKQVALFNRQIVKKIKNVKREYMKIIPYSYTIQHIFHTDKDVADKVMLEYEKLKSFDGFSQLAAEYSLETATRTRQGILDKIDLSTNKVTSHFYYVMNTLKVGEPVMIRDPFGYHIVKILKKEDHDVSAIKNNKKLLNMGLMDYRKYIFFEELKKKYNVEYYSENYMGFLSKDPETPRFSIDGRIVTKNEMLAAMDVKKQQNPLLKAQLTMTSVAPIVESTLQDMLAALEAEAMAVDKEITKNADELFKNYIFSAWYDNVLANLSVKDIPAEKIEKLYDTEEFKMVTSKQFAIMIMPSYEYATQIAAKYNTKKAFESYMKDNISKLRYSTNIYKGHVPEEYAEFEKYLDTEVGTVLPVMQWKGNYIVAMTYGEDTHREITLVTYTSRFLSAVHQMRVYQTVLDYWKTVEGLELTDETVRVFESTIAFFKKTTVDRLEQIDKK